MPEAHASLACDPYIRRKWERCSLSFIPVLQPVTMATLVLRSYSSIFGVASRRSLRATAVTGRVERLQKTAKGPSKNVNTQVGSNGNTIMLQADTTDRRISLKNCKVGPSYTLSKMLGLEYGSGSEDDEAAAASSSSSAAPLAAKKTALPSAAELLTSTTASAAPAKAKLALPSAADLFSSNKPALPSAADLLKPSSKAAAAAPKQPAAANAKAVQSGKAAAPAMKATAAPASASSRSGLLVPAHVAHGRVNRSTEDTAGWTTDAGLKRKRSTPAAAADAKSSA
eukprot:5831-Heterococcus_DN1.PRE.2